MTTQKPNPITELISKLEDEFSHDVPMMGLKQIDVLDIRSISGWLQKEIPKLIKGLLGPMEERVNIKPGKTLTQRLAKAHYRNQFRQEIITKLRGGTPQSGE